MKAKAKHSFTSSGIGAPQAADHGMEKLAAGFIPGAFDVICSRGKSAYQHQGNRSFRATLEHHLPSYANARSKQEKTQIVSLIYHGIQEATPDGGFIRKNNAGEWCRVPCHVAREKVSAASCLLLLSTVRSTIFFTLASHLPPHILFVSWIVLTDRQRKVGQG